MKFLRNRFAYALGLLLQESDTLKEAWETMPTFINKNFSPENRALLVNHLVDQCLLDLDSERSKLLNEVQQRTKAIEKINTHESVKIDKPAS